MKFQNTTNGYEEKISNYTWLWVLLFGFFYFATKGIWRHAVVSLVLAIPTFGFSWVIYPFFAEDIVIKNYLKNGWVLVKD